MKSAIKAKRLAKVLCFALSFATGLEASAQDAGAAPTAEQQKILETIGQYAGSYIAQLPNFVCHQITEQYEADKKGKHWHKGDTLNAKLVFSGGREQRTLELVNNKQLRGNYSRSRTPLSTEGEFGILLSRVFEEGSQANFSWGGWDTIRGHKVARFDYSIDREHSSMSLTNYVKAVVPYHGSVYGDPETGAVWKVTSGTTDIPEVVQIKSIATTVEYDEILIGTRKYLLPVTATVLLAADRDQTRNEMQFADYRKFEAESTITFGGDDQKPDAQKPQQ